MAETKEIGTEKGEQKPCLTGLCIEGRTAHVWN